MTRTGWGPSTAARTNLGNCKFGKLTFGKIPMGKYLISFKCGCHCPINNYTLTFGMIKNDCDKQVLNFVNCFFTIVESQTTCGFQIQKQWKNLRLSEF